MSDLRAAALRALEALEYYRSGEDYQPTPSSEAITSLKAALAEPVEPVAWMVYTEGGASAYVTDNPRDLIGAHRSLPLYTSPPQRPAAPIIQPEIKADKEPRLLPWKGLTEEEHTYYKACGFVGVKAVEEKLRARNSTLACHQGEEGK